MNFPTLPKDSLIGLEPGSQSTKLILRKKGDDFGKVFSLLLGFGHSPTIAFLLFALNPFLRSYSPIGIIGTLGALSFGLLLIIRFTRIPASNILILNRRKMTYINGIEASYAPESKPYQV